MATLTLNVPDELMERLKTVSEQTEESIEDLFLEGATCLLAHLDDMFSSIKDILDKNPNLSLDELESAWREKHGLEEEDHVHDGKGCCAVHG